MAIWRGLGREVKNWVEGFAHMVTEGSGYISLHRVYTFIGGGRLVKPVGQSPENNQGHGRRVIQGRLARHFGVNVTQYREN